MSLENAGKERKKQIKSLRSKRTALLKQRDLSMKGRTAAQQCLENVTLAAKEKKEQEPKEVRILVYVR